MMASETDNPLVGLGSDVIGEAGLLGDERWAGLYGVDADYIALRHCTVLQIENEQIMVIASAEAV
jgi:hypothetical protein